ncbi:MAG: hypothetical protein JSV33_09545 [bacterium]|nr:MAG: hypothetical protein JSV33_09545 [bacterium]
MKRLFMLAAVLCLIILLNEPAYALDARNGYTQVKRQWTRDEYTSFSAPIPHELRTSAINTSAQVDTYTIVYYDFEEIDWQGWTKIDNTRRYIKCFFHVDDFSGLPGWSPLEGTKSMWCGTRPDAGDPYLCSWVSAPGYGNNWKQSFVSDPFETDEGNFTLSFRALFDIEPVYDWISIDYDRGSR